MCEESKNSTDVSEEVLQKFLSVAIPSMARGSFDFFIRWDDRYQNDPKGCIERYIDELNFLLNPSENTLYYINIYSKLSPENNRKVRDYLQKEIDKWSAELKKLG